MYPHNHTCISRLHTHTQFRDHKPIFTSCLHQAQLGCERMHFWQEGAGWQDPGRDRLGSLHSVASCEDELLASNSLSPLLRASRKTRTIDKATMVCNRYKGGHVGPQEGPPNSWSSKLSLWLSLSKLYPNSFISPHSFTSPCGFSSFFKMAGKGTSQPGVGALEKTCPSCVQTL